MPLQNPVSSAETPVFWRDARLPFIEARSIADGRNGQNCFISAIHSAQKKS